MRRPCLLLIFIFCSVVLAYPDGNIGCTEVLKYCQKTVRDIPRCVENSMRNCRRPRIVIGFSNPDLYLQSANSSYEARVDTVYGHVIHIPPEAVLKSKETDSDPVVHLTVSVLNSSLFEAPSNNGSLHEQVLGVWLGDKDVHDLSQPVRMVFANVNQAPDAYRNNSGHSEAKNESRKCVFWKLSSNSEQGSWSTDGCNSIQNGTDLICECNHLSFFAVLVSPDVPDPADVQRLEYITYIGSSLSVVFTVITLGLFLCHRKRKSEHSVAIHMHLTGSLFLLHLFFLASTFWSEAERAACQSLGLMLHWALLATLTWTAIEGFHLYLLLVRVFNIYIRRYLLKLNLVGWGVPSITVLIAGLSGSYGRYTLTKNNSNVTSLCWVTAKAVTYVTNGYLGLALIFNIVILAVIMVKMRQLRQRNVQAGNRVGRFWKDWATVLGLSCVLGLPWGLAITTQGPLSLPGIYIFTILNSFQGVLMFLWFLSIMCKPSHEEQQSTKNFSMSNFNS